MDELGVLAACTETFFDCADEPLGGPDHVFGAFDDDAVPGEEGREDW